VEVLEDDHLEVTGINLTSLSREAVDREHTQKDGGKSMETEEENEVRLAGLPIIQLDSEEGHEVKHGGVL